MNFAAFFALARRDLRLFFMDRRAVIMSFVAPILIGSFFGYLFGDVSDREPSKIGVSVVNQDDEKFYEKHVRILLPALIAHSGALGSHSEAVAESVLAILEKTGSIPTY